MVLEVKHLAQDTIHDRSLPCISVCEINIMFLQVFSYVFDPHKNPMTDAFSHFTEVQELSRTCFEASS